MDKNRNMNEPKRMPPGEPGDDLRSDPVALSRTGRPYFKTQWNSGWGSSSSGVAAWLIILVLVIAVIVALYNLS
ncbi:MAG: hypothetical protein KKB37_01395 [Alphaproteobacteria bacterium]|nr:hypothetical protein [Alphaproteobacteria bacterium]